MNLDLTDEEATGLFAELDRIIDNDQYPFSPRIRTLKQIRAKIKPHLADPPLPPSKYYPGRVPRGAARNP